MRSFHLEVSLLRWTCPKRAFFLISNVIQNFRNWNIGNIGNNQQIRGKFLHSSLLKFRNSYCWIKMVSFSHFYVMNETSAISQNMNIFPVKIWYWDSQKMSILELNRKAGSLNEWWHLNNTIIPNNFFKLTSKNKSMCNAYTENSWPNYIIVLQSIYIHTYSSCSWYWKTKQTTQTFF